MRSILFIILIFTTCKVYPLASKWVRVIVPPYLSPGEEAVLECNYDLDNGTLYAVKWYKDQEEFYRFVPKAIPQAQSFQIDGVEVNVRESDSRKVILRPVNLKTSGIFTCEVSAEAPSFNSAQSEAKMEVLYLPKQSPVITGIKEEYRVGDEVDLNCTSGKGHPTPSIQWYINNNQVTNYDSLKIYPPVKYKHGLKSSRRGLHFILNNHHFADGSVRIKCVSVVFPAMRYHKDEDSAVEHTPLSYLEEMLFLVSSFGPKTSMEIVFVPFFTILALSSAALF